MLIERKWKQCTDDQKEAIRDLYDKYYKDFFIRSPEDIMILHIIKDQLVGFAVITDHFPNITHNKCGKYIYNLITIPNHKSGHIIMSYIEEKHSTTVHVYIKNMHAFKFFKRRNYICNGMNADHYELTKKCFS